MTDHPLTRASTVFETERLRVRPLDLDRDLQPLFEMYSDPVVMEHIGGEAYRQHTIEQTRERMERRLSADWAPARGMWAFERRDDGELIGINVLRDMNPEELDRAAEAKLDPGTPMVEFGYHLRRPHWGNRYAGEIAAGTVRHAFQTGGFDVVHATVAPDNVRSKRILTGLGLTYVTTAIFGIEHDLFRLYRRDWSVEPS